MIPKDQESGKGHHKTRKVMISWQSCLSHDTNLCTRLRCSNDNDDQKQCRITRQTSVFPCCQSFPLSALMLLFPEDKCSCSQDQSLFVGKVKCLRSTSVIPLPLPLVSPAQSAKHTQASQPLGSHGKKEKHIPLFVSRKHAH